MIDAIAERNMQALGENSYPGRGIILGRTDRDRLVQIYWVMGRSDDSRNRILAIAADSNRKKLVRTEPFDTAKLKDPSLIIYNAMRTSGRWRIVSNGNQTDTVFEHFMGADGDFEGALDNTFHEPDAPNNTPRITGLTDTVTGEMKLSKISRNPINPQDSVRTYYNYKNMPLGYGFCIHTYNKNGNPLPSFDMEPYPVLVQGDTSDILRTYWNLLNRDNKVAMVARTVGLGTGGDHYAIANALQK